MGRMADQMQAGLKRYLVLVTDPLPQVMLTRKMDSLSGHLPTSRLDMTWMGRTAACRSKWTGQVCTDVGMRNQPAILGGAADTRLFPIEPQARQE